jgi:hypothetical protein
MYGHEPLIEMRKKGQKPSIVFLTDYPGKPNWHEQGDYPEVSVYHDVPERADLRFLVNLNVNITASSKDRAKALLEACRKAGAQTVTTMYWGSNSDNYFRMVIRGGMDRFTEDKPKYES